MREQETDIKKGDYVSFETLFGDKITGLAGDIEKGTLSEFDYRLVFMSGMIYHLRKNRKVTQLDQPEHRKPISWNEMKDIWIPEELKHD